MTKMFCHGRGSTFSVGLTNATEVITVLISHISLIKRWSLQKQVQCQVEASHHMHMLAVCWRLLRTSTRKVATFLSMLVVSVMHTTTTGSSTRIVWNPLLSYIYLLYTVRSTMYSSRWQVFVSAETWRRTQYNVVPNVRAATRNDNGTHQIVVFILLEARIPRNEIACRREQTFHSV